MPLRRNYDETKYYEESFSPLSKTLGGVIAIAGISMLGFKAYKSGKLRPAVERIIKNLGDYSGSLHSLQGIKRWSETENMGSLFKSSLLDDIKSLRTKIGRQQLYETTRDDISKLKQQIDKARSQGRKAKIHGIANASDAKGLHWLYSDPEFIKNYKNIIDIEQKLNKQKNVPSKAIEEMYDKLLKTFRTSTEAQKETLKVSGYRHVTLGDVIDQNKWDVILSKKSSEAFRKQLETLASYKGSKWKDVVLDTNILINKQNEISDLRGFKNSAKQILDTMSNQFHIPFINLNPIKLANLDKYAKESKPLFAIFKKGTVQTFTHGMKPIKNVLSGKLEPLEDDLFYIAGNVFTRFDLNKPIASNIELRDINISHDIVSNYLREMSGIQMKTYKETGDTEPIRKYWSKLANLIDIGKQDMEANKFDLLSPYTYMSFIDKILQGPLRSHGGIESKKILSQIFGSHEGYIGMKKSVKLKDTIMGKENITDYAKQFMIGRKNIEETTPIGMLPYAFVARLERSLSSVGLGPSIEHTGSAADISKWFMTRRILPIMAGAGILGYVNWESEKLTGINPKETLADAYVNAKINYTGLKDILGITDLAKEITKITPGSENIAELPIVSMFDLAHNAEEMEQFYKEGKEPVRKGKFWPLGGTRFIGERTQYYRDNWYKRMKSDWQFTESLYGSREEYYKHSWMPTPRYPFAPVRHFITDNRWLEEKHYYDRPYPISEGIPELEGIPIFGELLDMTIGRLLKPPKKMHPEYWENGQLVSRPDLEETEYNIVDNQTGLPVDITTYNKKSGMGDGISNKGVQTINNSITPEANTTIAEQDVSDAVYITSSGNIQPISIPETTNIDLINEQLQKQSLAKSIPSAEAKRIYTDMEPIEYTEQEQSYDKPLNEAVIDIGELGGIYGFSILGNTMHEMEWEREMATPSDIQSWRDMFWELNIGGFGGEISEIYRRFIPRDKNRALEFNPIRNTMPSWMPDENYFLDLQHGDPFSKIPYGEIRLPGEGFEAINQMNEAALTATDAMFGKDINDIYKTYFHENDLMNSEIVRIQHKENIIRNRILKQMNKNNTLIDMNVKITDKELNYSGMIDAIVYDESTKNNKALVNIEAVNKETYENIKKGFDPKQETSRLNAQLKTTDTERGYIYYVPLEGGEPIIKGYNYSEELFQEDINRINEARQLVSNSIISGAKERGDLYDYLTRFKILGDVAPYSKEFQYYKKIMSIMREKGLLSEEEREEIAQTKSQVADMKDKVPMTPYMFKTANLQYEKVTIKEMLDNNMVLVEEYPDHPIKLAGIYVPTGKNDEIAQQARNILEKQLYKGAKIQIGYDADNAKKFTNDTYSTIRAVISTKDIDNVNRYLLKKGLAKEKESDVSPAGIHARFSNTEILAGTAWEKFAHMETIAHTKFLQVKSPYEQYKKRQVYGKEFQDWSHPIRDFVIPTFEDIVEEHPLVATAAGAFAGFLFGKKRYGKILGSISGALIAGLSASAISSKEAVTGKTWIPERRKKEREIEEYMDILKYVKAKKLYEEYRIRAKKEDNIDVEKYIKEQKIEGKAREKIKSEIIDIKRKLKTKQISPQEAIKKIGYKGKVSNSKEAISILNKYIKETSEYRKIEKLSENAIKSILYYQEAEKTMYGYDQGEPLTNILTALPKKDREYFLQFIDAPEEEKQKILDIVPEYMKRPLQSMWGMKVDAKPNLIEYFTKHQLPDTEWRGWRENVPLTETKIKIIKNEAQDYGEFNIWPEDIREAEAGRTPIPQMNVKTNSHKIKERLLDLLRNAGYEDINISVVNANHSNINIDMNIYNDKMHDIKEALKKYGDSML